MRILLFSSLFLAILCSAVGQSQMANFYFEKGKVFYDEKEYENALEKFEQALSKNAEHADALYYASVSSYELDKLDNTIKYSYQLQKVNKTYWSWHIYLRGKAHISKSKFKEAEEDFTSFMELYSSDADRVHYKHQAAYLKEYAKNAAKVRSVKTEMENPINLAVMNTISDDMMPQINPTGDRLYFTSTRKGGMDDVDEDEENDWGEDLYFIEKNGNNWTSPTLLPEPINSYNNDGTSTFSADGQQMIYVKCNEEGGIGNCDLWMSELEGENWSKPFNVGDVVNSKEWDSQPTLSADGNTIIFISSRDGSYAGSMDMYLSRKNKFGQWGPPQNMGPTLNTPLGEKSPYLAPDGKTLYFSSNGHAGYGNYDIFMSVMEDSKWSEPKNLGAPLNSKGEDTYFSISASGEGAYFASDRSGKGKLDLFSVSIPENLRPKASVIVKGIVTNAKTKNNIDAWVLVEDLTTGELIATAKSNSASGKYLVVLPAGRNYSVSANKEGYFFYSNQFDVPKTAKYQEITKDIALKPIEKGARVVLNNIFFETGKATLTQESYIELSKAIDLLKVNPKMVVEIGGHTDNVGSDEANMKLSHNRAKSVRDYLVKAGISSERLQSKGYGETEPVADNSSEAGRKANRRTEFVILEN